MNNFNLREISTDETLEVLKKLRSKFKEMSVPEKLRDASLAHLADLWEGCMEYVLSIQRLVKSNQKIKKGDFAKILSELEGHLEHIDWHLSKIKGVFNQIIDFAYKTTSDDKS